jgi:hypothetical protein
MKNFLKIRAAFEIENLNKIRMETYLPEEARTVVVGSSGSGVPFTDRDELREWYQEETGDFCDASLPSTRQEVIEVYKTMLSGESGTRKGGYWDWRTAAGGVTRVNLRIMAARMVGARYRKSPRLVDDAPQAK